MCEGKNVYIYTYIHIWAHTRAQTWYTQKRCDKRIITQYLCRSEYNKQLQYANICTYGQKNQHMIDGCTYMWSVCRSTILLRIIAEIRYTRGCRRNKWRRLLESSNSWKSSESAGYISAQVDISASSKSKDKKKTNVPKCPRTGSDTISSCRWRDHVLWLWQDPIWVVKDSQSSPGDFCVIVGLLCRLERSK